MRTKQACRWKLILGVIDTARLCPQQSSRLTYTGCWISASYLRRLCAGLVVVPMRKPPFVLRLVGIFICVRINRNWFEAVFWFCCMSAFLALKVGFCESVILPVFVIGNSNRGIYCVFNQFTLNWSKRSLVSHLINTPWTSLARAIHALGSFSISFIISQRPLNAALIDDASLATQQCFFPLNFSLQFLIWPFIFNSKLGVVVQTGRGVNGR